MRFYQASFGKQKSAASMVLVFALFLLLGSLLVFYRLNPLACAVASAKANVYLQQLCDRVVLSYLEESQLQYQDLILLEKNEEGNINAVLSNTVAVNRMKSNITSRVSEEIGQLDRWALSVPLGALTGSSFMSGVGPNIPITVAPNGRVFTELKSEFESAAINQTIHRLVLETKLDIGLLLPAATTSTTVVTQVPIAETIIVGNVPSSYTAIDGVTSDAPDTALNLLD
ncbi:MAG: sporulation protein YunB [Clostridia bacterium]|nr:sporulation protein YunB [Clostridia bacterium]